MATARLRPAPGMFRRGVLAAGSAFGAGALLTACGGADSDAGSAAPAGTSSGAEPSAGPFSSTGDRTTRVELDRPPAHLIAYVGSAAAPHDHGVECAGVFGPTALKAGSPDAQACDLDVTSLADRSATLQPEDLTGRPTWMQLPAVKAGQIHDWPSEPIFSYATCTDQLEALTKTVTTAKKVS